MSKIDSVMLKAKIRGSLLGSLLGDCFGGPFEGDAFSPGLVLTIKKYFDKLDGPYFKTPQKGYSDDTIMTKSVAQTLIEKPAVDYKHMARLFVQEYFLDPRRGYGQNVVDVFYKLRNEKFEDVFGPAQDQFGGRGSYGNGGAMRIAPIALFFHHNYDAMLQAARKTTQITHTNKLGINGALLQCIAIYQSLHLDPKEKFDANLFAMNLMEKMREIESVTDGIHDEDPIPYQTQLNYLMELLKCNNPEDPVNELEVIGSLGNSVAALHSVPTAIYCFLKAHSGFPGIESENVFRRAIQYAITLGGDTDTIAAMTGAIAGAYFGESHISENMLKHCEFYKETQELADNLFVAMGSVGATAQSVN